MMPAPATEVLRAGAPPDRARAAMILLHGRGATAEGMLSLSDAFAQAGLAYVAPQAPGHTWYPYSFLVPLEQNEPALSRALAMVDDTLSGLVHDGMPRDRVILLGFSQGGCLALEYAARNASRYGGLVGLSAGLIGPPNTARDYAGSLAGTPVFLGCSDVDPHIPLWRVRESTQIMRRMDGEMTERIYPGMGHAINEDEVAHIRGMLAELLANA
jgi:phospholipase/carboxylesterase